MSQGGREGGKERRKEIGREGKKSRRLWREGGNSGSEEKAEEEKRYWDIHTGFLQKKVLGPSAFFLFVF